MSSIFSTQNLQTFLRRKNLRPPPPSRGGPPGPRPPPPPPKRGRSPPGRSPPGRSPLGRSPLERGLSLGADCSAAFVSSAIVLLFVGSRFPRHLILCHSERSEESAFARRIHECRQDRLAALRRRRSFRRRHSRFRRCRLDRRLRAHLLLRVAQLLDLVQPLLFL